jgi:hypothetical protein
MIRQRHLRAGHASRIDFDPLRVRAVAIPPGCLRRLSQPRRGGKSAPRAPRTIAGSPSATWHGASSSVLGTSLPRPPNISAADATFPDRPVSEFVAASMRHSSAPLALEEIASVVGAPVEACAARSAAPRPRPRTGC